MSIKIGIILIVISVPIIFIGLIFYLYCGENGYNKYCEKANTCPRIS